MTKDSPGVSLDDLGMSIEDLRMCLGCGLVYGDDDIHAALHVWMDNRPQTTESRDPQVEDDKVIALAKLKGRATATRILAGERSNPDDEPSEDDPPVFDREAAHDDPRVDAILDTAWPLIAGKPGHEKFDAHRHHIATGWCAVCRGDLTRILEVADRSDAAEGIVRVNVDNLRTRQEVTALLERQHPPQHYPGSMAGNYSVDAVFNAIGEVCGYQEPARRADTIPAPVEGEVFGFWFQGIWQPVLAGVTVEAVDAEHVTFHYPKPGGDS